MNATNIAVFLVFMPPLAFIAERLIQKLIETPSSVTIASVPPIPTPPVPPESCPMPVSVVDVKLSLSVGHSKISKHCDRTLEDINRPKGNALEASKGTSLQEKLILVLRMAESIQVLHSMELIHGNISPGAFRVEDEYLTLFDATLYAAAQAAKQVEFIRMRCSHQYKARAELVQETFTPVEAMDVFCWAKTVTAIYVGSHPTLTFSKSIPLPIQPQEMPDTLWHIVYECLTEDLSNIPSMDEIIVKLDAIT
ncbi:hypothetical protein BDQ17DRAFT_1425237 [Cyathus striatus]|nr:hypothetical protein BDQ17DRAFT_1425237 [Cyathus striatus]